MTAPLNSAPRADIVLKANTARTVPFVFKDESGQAIDYTGSTFKLEVKARDANNEPTGSVLLTLATGSGIAGDVSLGEFEPTFPAAASSGLPAGQYIYDVLRLESAVAVEPVMVGLIDVEEGITT